MILMPVKELMPLNAHIIKNNCHSLLLIFLLEMINGNNVESWEPKINIIKNNNKN